MRTHPLLKVPQLGHGQGIGLADDGDDIDARCEPSHEFDVDLSEAECSSRGESNIGCGQAGVLTHDLLVG